MKWLICIASLLVFVSCNKSVDLPTSGYPISPVVDTSKDISIFGKFVIIDANMFVNNKETGEKIRYKHFSPNRLISSLRYDGSIFDIETIVKDVTTFSFYRNGIFLLNSDSTKLYGLLITSSYTSIIEHPTSMVPLLGGSSRPFRGWTIDFNQKIVILHIQDVEASINGYNCNYFTELKLKKIKEW